jgi:hypothetical protein
VETSFPAADHIAVDARLGLAEPKGQMADLLGCFLQ